MSNFDRAFDLLLEHEGGFVNDPRDAGGATRYGVTKETARLSGYTGDMRDLPLSLAKQIYQEQYWRKEFDQLPFSVAFNVFDGVVNSGAPRSIKWLQSAVGVSVDGIWGPKTLSAAMSNNPFNTVLKYNAARLEYLTDLSNWNAFGKGWSRRIAKNLTV
jgi:lysozyme family protein